MGLNPFWPHKFGFKPLLGLEHMAPIRLQFLANCDNHVCMYADTRTHTHICMDGWFGGCIYVPVYLFITLWILIYIYLLLIYNLSDTQ